MSKLSPEEQRKLALNKIGRLRDELVAQGRPISEYYLAEQGAHYSGASVDQVRQWMAGAK